MTAFNYVFKGKAPPDVNPNDAEESVQEETEKEEEEPEPTGNIPVQSQKFFADLERLKAQIDALNQVKDSWSQRFSDISERVGELRTLIAETDNKIAGIEAKSEKASTLVEDLKPEKIMEGLEKEEAKYEALKAKIESNQAIYTSILDELRDLRKRVGMFRGVDALVKLSDEVKDELISIQKIKAVAEAHADKVEQMFMDLRGTFKDFAQFTSTIKEIEASLGEAKKLLSKHDVKIKSYVEKKDIGSLIGKVNFLLKRMETYASTITKSSSEIDRFVEIVEGNKKNIESLRERERKIKDFIDQLSTNVDDKNVLNLKDAIDKNSKRLKDILEIIEIMTNKVVGGNPVIKTKEIITDEPVREKKMKPPKKERKPEVPKKTKRVSEPEEHPIKEIERLEKDVKKPLESAQYPLETESGKIQEAPLPETPKPLEKERDDKKASVTRTAKKTPPKKIKLMDKYVPIKYKASRKRTTKIKAFSDRKNLMKSIKEIESSLEDLDRDLSRRLRKSRKSK